MSSITLPALYQQACDSLANWAATSDLFTNPTNLDPALCMHCRPNIISFPSNEEIATAEITIRRSIAGAFAYYAWVDVIPNKHIYDDPTRVTLKLTVPTGDHLQPLSHHNFVLITSSGAAEFEHTFAVIDNVIAQTLIKL